ncbi:MAG: HlyD family type I secretion periplasmic adaptor subunit [Rhodopila sp.]
MSAVSALSRLFQPQPALASSQALLEFQSPTAAVLAERVPLSGRMTIWTISSTILASLAVISVYSVDRVVTVSGKVVADIPNIVVQPLDTSIVRQVNVHEGQVVHAGDVLASLDPTFARADAGAVDTQVASLQAEVDRLAAESEGRAYTSDGSPASQLQAMIYAQRHAEQISRIENYRRRIDSANARLAQTQSDIASYAEQLKDAQARETMRQQLEKLQIGSKLNTLDAGAQRAEINRYLQAAIASNQAAKGDLDALTAELDGYRQQTRIETSQLLTEQGRKLADAKEQQSKAALRRNLVTLEADRDAVVLNVAKVSLGSVVQSGDELVTLVPTDAPLRVEASIPARDAGFVHPGNQAVIKFDTFPYTIYGYATGTLNTVSADSFAPHDNGGRPVRPGQAEADTNPGANYFRASLSLNDMKLHDLPAGFHMTPGMPVTADIKIGRRTIMSYLMARVVPTLTEGLREP